MKKTFISWRTLGPIVAIFALLIAVGCEAPVGIASQSNSVNKAAVSVWAPNVSYLVGDMVTYNGPALYRCRQAHTSLPGWDPVSAPALWENIGAVDTPTPSPTPTFTPTPTPTTTTSAPPTPTPTPSGVVKATGVPGAPALSQSSWNGESSFTITMNMWWGNNGTTWELYENGALVSSKVLTDNSPSAQVSSVAFSGKANGTYVYTTKLINVFGATTGNTLTYTVTQGTGTTPTPTPTPTITPTPTPTPTGTATPTPTPTPSGTPDPRLPTHLLTGYLTNWSTPGATTLRLTDVPTSYRLIAIAFADATSTPGAVSFTPDAASLGSVSQVIADIATVKARGQHVIISVGGEKGSIVVNDSASAANFANSVNALIAQYGFEGVDIDLENGINATFMAQALRNVNASIITMAPQTIDMQNTSMGYFQLALAIQDKLTICNTQYYNSGTMLGYDGKVYAEGGVDFLTALATIQLENGLRGDQVGLGLPASPSGAGNGYVSPTIVNQAYDVLTTGASFGTYRPPHTYPTLRGVMDWSINWDAATGYAFANTVYPHFPIPLP